MSHTETYTYDGVNRLLTARADDLSGTCLWGVSMSGGNDRWGNLTGRGVTCGTATGLSLSVNGSNQFNTPGFTYDAAGNLTRDPLHTYQWDAEGRVVSVDGVAGQACQATWTACYVYDAEGQRVEKQTGATYNEYVYDGYGGVAFVTDRLSWVDAEIPSWGSRPLARYYTGNTDFPHRDALGSSIYVTQHPGWVAQKLTFYPWGQLWQNTWVRDERFASLGRRDAESGLDPTAFRTYSSQYSRWLSPDPLTGDVTNPQSLNRYAYALNNPATLTDPSGQGPAGRPCPLVHDVAPPGCGNGAELWSGGGMDAWAGQVETRVSGYSFLDAVIGAPGTYLAVDQRGNMGFGFSLDLYNETENLIDAERRGAAGSSLRDFSIPATGYTVFYTGIGLPTGTQVSGLIPDRDALAAERNELVAMMPEGARGLYYRDLATYGPEVALSRALGEFVRYIPNFDRTRLGGFFAQYAQHSTALAQELFSFLGIKF